MGSNVAVDASSPDASLSLLLSDNASLLREIALLLREIGGDESFALFVDFDFCFAFELEVAACDVFEVDAFDGKADRIIC